MSETFTAEGIREIFLTNLKVSTTGSQAERRAHFDKAAIAELAESIKTVGLLSPIVARPVNGHFEVVAGERRFLAAKQAGLIAVNVSVRELTDEQVLEVQLIENLQREGLHEIAEAEGYEALHKLGHSAEEIADKVGKSKAYVYARMKLLALAKPARSAFYEGKISASIALLLARIPVESLQKEALKEILDGGPYGGDGGMSYRQAAELVQQDYMQRLDQAGFPTEDATLLAAAGACGACPKRTGNQPELFGDIKRADVCTDTACFRSKRDAHAAREIAKGRLVLDGKKAKEVLPYGPESSARGGYVKLEDKNWDDPKRRTNAQLLGKGFEPVFVKDPKSGALVPVAPESAVKKALQDAGVKPPSSSGSNPQSAAEKKAKLEKKFRAALYSEIRAKLPADLGQGDLKTIALRFFEEMQNDTQKQVLGLWQLEPAKAKGGYGLDTRKPMAARIADMDDGELARFLFDLVFVSELQVHTWASSPATLLLATAKKLRVNPEQIKRQLNAASIPKAKKKAARKTK